MVRISPNSRLSFCQISPPSVERNIWPRLAQQNSSIGSAGLVATHHTVLLTGPGSRVSSQVWPWSRLRQSRPSAPGGPLPLVMNITPLSSARGITARLYCQGEGSSKASQLSPHPQGSVVSGYEGRTVRKTSSRSPRSLRTYAASPSCKRDRRPQLPRVLRERRVAFKLRGGRRY